MNEKFRPIGKYQEPPSCEGCAAKDHEVEALKAEVNEQARLNGMGGSREAKLLAKVAALEKERDGLRAALRGLQECDHGLQGGISDGECDCWGNAEAALAAHPAPEDKK